VAADCSARVHVRGLAGCFANGVIKFLTFLFFVSLFYHAWIGVRDIWMDYIKPTVCA
jgi:succinate dehydrogenase hydrophobic membrane anchor protein